MSDFEAALQEKLARNAELARQREEAEQQMDQFVARQQAEEERRQAEVREAQRQRHGELVEALSSAAKQLKAASPEDFVARLGWTESGEEFIAKISTRLMEPSRSLFIELDRDDDEVLARWHSDVGSSLELWRLLEVPPSLLRDLVLQVADQEVWRQRSSPPPFPRP
jgi:multidrug efflux pump subunit AcrA (membrane-fusion protein)